MDEIGLLKTLQTDLESKLSLPVKVAGLENERPVPSVIIQNWDSLDFNFHNSNAAGRQVASTTADGTPDEIDEFLMFDTEIRVEFLVRHEDEVKAGNLKSRLKKEIRLIAEDPLGWNQDVKEVTIGRGGQPAQTFTESRESELLVVARFHVDHQVIKTYDDTIEDITQSFKITNN